MKGDAMENCIDCPNHLVINDPDPDDWFCDDDVAVVCIKVQNDNIDLASKYASNRYTKKSITSSIF